MNTDVQMTVLFAEEEEGGYTATVPALPGCISYGVTIEKAKKNIQRAIRLHLACVKTHAKSKRFRPAVKNIFAAILSLRTA